MAWLSAEELLEEINKSSLSQTLEIVLFEIIGKVNSAQGYAMLVDHDLNNDEAILDNMNLASATVVKSLTDAIEILAVLRNANRMFAQNSSDKSNDSGN